MDVLSEVLAICRAERAVTARFSLGAPWALHSGGVPGAMIRLSRGAPYWIRLEGGAPVGVERGDLVMLPLGWLAFSSLMPRRVAQRPQVPQRS